MPRLLTGIEVIRHRQKECRSLWQKVQEELDIRENISGPPFSRNMCLLEQNLKHLCPHFLSLDLVRHNNHEIGQIEFVFRVLDKEFDGDIVGQIFVLHIVLNQGIVGKGHLGLIRAIMAYEAKDTLNACLVILVAFHEPVKSLLCLPLLVMKLK